MTTMIELVEKYAALCDDFGLSTYEVDANDPNDLWWTLAETIEEAEELEKVATGREELDVAEGLVGAIEALRELQDLALDQPAGSDADEEAGDGDDDLDADQADASA